METTHEPEFWDVDKPLISEDYGEQTKHFLIEQFSRFDVNLKERVQKLEFEIDFVKKEIDQLKETKNQNLLTLLSHKLISQGNYAVLKDETYEVLLITDNRREALNFSSDKKGVFILRLR